jgi:MarR family transcriptional regulator, organic hydroperoxide resistance regulator
VPATHPQLELDRQVCFALHAASRAVVRAYGPLLDAAHLTYTQYLVLLVLWETPDQPPSLGHLGERLQLDSGTLTPLCKRLEGLGYVERQRDPVDERRVLIALTPAGLALRDQLADVPLTLAARLDLTPESAAALREQLTALTAALEG